MSTGHGHGHLSSAAKDEEEKDGESVDMTKYYVSDVGQDE